MVVITIMGFVALASYIPYAHHQKKVLLKQATREIAQSLSDARSLAINGVSTASGNLNIGVYLSSGATDIIYYSVPYTESLTLTNLPAESFREKPLPVGTHITKIKDATETLFTFAAITGSGSTDPDLWQDEFPITVSYKWANTPALQRSMTYYPKSYVTDY